ncbi:MAG TPA: ATP-dependent DNA helicase [Patescibacteria group bacterium]|nr:ATP-dependent DNA helicase [Patescibacteria group bacterium]
MASKLLENLNEQQVQAVTHAQGRLLIVAGAGTGKTTVITRRIAYIVEQGWAKPEEILALTFTEKAADEMAGRAEQLLPLGYYDNWIYTFHGFCQRLLGIYGLDFGLSSEFKVLNEIQQWVTIKKNFEKFDLDYYRPLGNPDRFISALLKHFSRCKDELIWPEEYVAYTESLKLSGGTVDNPELDLEIKKVSEVASAYALYQKLLLEQGAMDFGDMVFYCVRLLEQRPNVRKRLQDKFKYILVDEFQDTNHAQFELIRLLENNNLTVVGDDDQSIYKFRGASFSNIQKLLTYYPNLARVTLLKNYRSCQNVLDLAYNFIQANNPDRLEVKLGINKRLTSSVPDSVGVISVLEGKDYTEELSLVVAKMMELKLKHSEKKWSDFAVLVRSNAAAEEVLPFLEQAGIPYTFMANKGLYKKKIIYQLISYIRLLLNFYDSASLLRVLDMKRFAIERQELHKTTTFAHKKSISVYEAMQHAELMLGLKPETQKAIQEITTLLKQHASYTQDKNAVEAFVFILTELGIVEELKQNTIWASRDRELVEQFYKKIQDFEQHSEDKTLRAFLGYLELEFAAGEEGSLDFDPETGPETVRVMTVHASKGLEFAYVFMPGLIDRRFPGSSRPEPIDIPTPLVKEILPEGDFNLQEERRLFYVAITRAKSELYFSWARDYGGKILRRPSKFLEETGLVPSEKVIKSTGKVDLGEKPTVEPYEYVFPLPESYSFSEISEFEKCPLQYKYRRLLKIPLPGSPYLSFGRSVHCTLELFAKRWRDASSEEVQDLFGGTTAGKLPDFGYLEKLYEENWIDDWYHSKKEKEEYKSKGKAMLKVVYDDFVQRKPQVRSVEQYFEFMLGEYKMVGKIDRVDMTENGLVILDYKTGKAKEKNGKGDLDQLMVYQIALEEEKQKVAGMYYWYLDANKRVYEEPGTEEVKGKLKLRIVTHIEKIIYAIKTDSFAKLHEKSPSHDCEFNDLE